MTPSRAARERGGRWRAIPDDEPRLVLATGRYIGEGFDDARLDTLFLAMPVSWKGTLVQYTGRLHRLHPGKTEVRIYDYVDREIPIFLRMFGGKKGGVMASRCGSQRRSLGTFPHLTLAQVFDALSYYADHQAEIERYIDQNQIPDDVVHPARAGDPDRLPPLHCDEDVSVVLAAMLRPRGFTVTTARDSEQLGR